jgi:hypothetical protein
MAGQISLMPNTRSLLPKGAKLASYETSGRFGRGTRILRVGATGETPAPSFKLTHGYHYLAIRLSTGRSAGLMILS